MKALAVLLVALPVCWGSTSGGLRAYDRGEHRLAFEIWLSDSERGDRESQYHLSLLYRDGQGVTKDLAKARQWLERSAQAGCTSAQTELGRFLDQGIAGRIDPVQARAWFERAVAEGNRSAMNELGRLYFRGRGMPVDDQRAFDLFQRAARSSRAAMFNLGLMYETGRGRPKDLAEAAAWYSLAAARGEPEAAEERDAMYASLSPDGQRRAKSREAALSRSRMWRDLWDNGIHYLSIVRAILTVLYGIVFFIGYFSRKNDNKKDDKYDEAGFLAATRSRARRVFLWYKPWGAMGWILHSWFFLVLAVCAVSALALASMPVDGGSIGLAATLLIGLAVSHWLAIQRDRATFGRSRPITGAE